MESMAQRVAKAIRDNIEAALPDGAPVDYGYAARAAIEAMREPDAPMVDAGWDESDASPAACWRAMVSAALSEPAAVRL